MSMKTTDSKVLGWVFQGLSYLEKEKQASREWLRGPWDSAAVSWRPLQAEAGGRMRLCGGGKHLSRCWDSKTGAWRSSEQPRN